MTNTKTKIALAASLALAALAVAVPAQAATRHVAFSMQTFADRCIDKGGVLEARQPLLSCQTGTVRVDCEFRSQALAECRWPGIDNQIAVNRIIGPGDASSISSNGGGFAAAGNNGGNGGNGGGGGGIDLPDLPLAWN